MLKIRVENATTAGPGRIVSLRCPACRQQGTFELFPSANDLITYIQVAGGPPQFFLGQRRCPNPACHNQVFVVINAANGALIASYPPERFDFDSTSIPGPVAKAFEEATACHSQGSFTAAAMMVRKTLELLCGDRGASGDDLKARIRNLGTKIVIPGELLQASDDLRLLGNDAAHIEARTYDEIGHEEVEAAFALTKEILKATYQYGALLERLKSLKKTAGA
jgi:hypothetical protein